MGGIDRAILVEGNRLFQLVKKVLLDLFDKLMQISKLLKKF